MWKSIFLLASLGACMVCTSPQAQVPQQVNYQAKVEAEGVPFDGVGQFKFAIVDPAGTNTYWSNDGTSTGGGEPTNAVSLNVSGGLLNVMLGDASHPHMQSLPASAFLHPDTWLRAWFGGGDGAVFERLAPDSKLASVPYAMVAGTVPDGSLTGEKLARESVWPVHEGRDNTIVSYFAEYTGTNLVTVATIASNKNFIITDLAYGSASGAEQEAEADVQVRFTKEGSDTILYKQWTRATYTATVGLIYIPPTQVAFKSGLVVPARAQLKIGGWQNYSFPRSCTVAGFEIPVE